MQDRVPLYPGRVTLTPVTGQANTYDMVRADQPTQEGTPLNKATLLKDATAALFGLDADALPDDVLASIANGFNKATDAEAKAGILNTKWTTPQQVRDWATRAAGGGTAFTETFRSISGYLGENNSSVFGTLTMVLPLSFMDGGFLGAIFGSDITRGSESYSGSPKYRFVGSLTLGTTTITLFDISSVIPPQAISSLAEKLENLNVYNLIGRPLSFSEKITIKIQTKSKSGTGSYSYYVSSTSKISGFYI